MGASHSSFVHRTPCSVSFLPDVLIYWSRHFADVSTDAILDDHLDDILANMSIIVNEEITSHQNNTYNNHTNTYNSSSQVSEMTFIHGSVTLQCLNLLNGTSGYCDDDNPEIIGILSKYYHD